MTSQHHQPDIVIPPTSVNAACKLWFVINGHYEPDPDPGSHWGVFWEPLDVKLGPDARPSCCYGDCIRFYDRSGNIADLVRHHSFIALHPHLVMLAWKWREVIGGRCEYHALSKRWCMRWAVATNTRFARMINEGWSNQQEKDSK